MKVPRIDIRSCDDWVAIYKDGKKVEEGHSCTIQRGLEALGIPYVERDLDREEWDIDRLTLADGSDAFPEEL